MDTFTLVFVLALATGTLLQLWLTHRQAAHVTAHRDAVPAPFADRISLQQHQKAADYTLARLLIERWRLSIAPLVLLAWTLGGLLNSVDGLLLDSGLPTLWQGALLMLIVLLVDVLIELPLDAWSTFRVESRFGFNRATPARFLKDKLLGMLLGLVFGVPLLLTILWLMEGAGSYWWLWAWLVWMGFTLFATWAFPTWIAPLFNKFEPLQQGPLRERLEALLARCGFRSNGMFVMDGSKRSAHGNAYFTGFGNNKRIVFFDTLLEGLEDRQVEAVLAHELGHFKLRHIIKMLMTSAAFSLLGLALLGWLAGQPWFFTGLGVERQGDALALILFILALPVFTVFLSPLMAHFTRRHEFEADAFAAENASAQALIDGLVNMYRDNASTLTPDPLYSAFHDSHPPAPLRIAHLSSKA